MTNLIKEIQHEQAELSEAFLKDEITEQYFTDGIARTNEELRKAGWDDSITT
jgi:hypothetical protein